MEFPDREFAPLVVHGLEGLQEVGGALPLNQAEERMECPEGVPDGEYGIAFEAFGTVDLAVHPAVLAVDVGVQRRVDGGVVQGCVEHAHLFLRAAADGYLGEIPVPGFACGGADLGETVRESAAHTCQVGFEVLPGIAGADRGDADAHVDGVGLGALEFQQGPAAVIVLERGYRLAELRPEIHVLAVGPAPGLAEAGDGGRAGLLDVRVQKVVAVLEVDDYLGFGLLGECITVIAGAPADGEGRADVRVLEVNLVVPGLRGLTPVAEARAVCLFVERPGIVPDRNEKDVAEVVAARSAQVCVAEAVNVLVRVVVSGAAVPVAGRGPGVRAQLDHAERPGGPGKGVAVEIGPDEGVHVLGVVLRRGGQAGEQQDGEKGYPSHIVRVFLWRLSGG